MYGPAFRLATPLTLAVGATFLGACTLAPPRPSDGGAAYGLSTYDGGTSSASDASATSVTYDGGTYDAGSSSYDGGTYGGGQCGSGYGSGPSDPNALLWSRHGGSPLWD